MKIYPSKILPFIVGLLIFLNLQPYFVWSLISNNYIRLSVDFITLGLLALKLRKFSNVDFNFFVFLFITLFLMAFFNGLNAFGMISTIILVIIPFTSHGFLKDSYTYFVRIYTIIMFLSMIVLLLLVLNIHLPYQIIPPLNTLKPYQYTAYPFLVIPGYGITEIPQLGRHCGPFDEPGVVGTIGLIILYIEKFNLRKLQNIIILISGIISFSLFFYVASLLFALYYVFVNKTKKIYRLLTIVSLSFVIFVSLDNELLSGYIWNRIKWDSEKESIAGDNRALDGLDKYFESIKGTKVYYFGLGLYNKELMTSFDRSAGYRNAILRYGFVSSALYCLFFFLFAYKQIGYRREYLLFLLIFITTLYQRPGLLLIHYIYLFVVFIMLNSKRELLNEFKQSVLKKRTLP